jgi:hypothetical protein
VNVESELALSVSGWWVRFTSINKADKQSGASCEEVRDVLPWEAL